MLRRRRSGKLSKRNQEGTRAVMDLTVNGIAGGLKNTGSLTLVRAQARNRTHQSLSGPFAFAKTTYMFPSAALGFSVFEPNVKLSKESVTWA